MKAPKDCVILIIDDEVGVTRLCVRLLTRVGYQTVAMQRPREGLEFLENAASSGREPQK